MSEKEITLSLQMKALKKTDLSPIIRMSGMMAPRLLGNFLPKLSSKQRKAFDKVMPVGGEKKFYTQLVGTPTPPIVIQLAQPIRISVMDEEEVKKEGIKGVRLTVEDLQLAQQKKYGKLLWRIKGQLGPILGMSGSFAPLVGLGPAELKDIKNRAMQHFKPLIDLMPKKY